MEDTLGVHAFFQVYACEAISLNPCSNGRYSRRDDKKLIRPCFSVLILVLMEDTLGGMRKSLILRSYCCLNPCSNGRYSRSALIGCNGSMIVVLILVLMEDTLGVMTTIREHLSKVLILVLMEDTLGG